MKNQFHDYIKQLQDEITGGLESVDGKATFKQDLWERPGGGGGRTRVISGGNVFEKGGVNISAVHGDLPDALRKHFNTGEGQFFACGLSMVIHPYSPIVPTVHANWRYFEMYDRHGKVVDQWFGGGLDLTPYYLFEEDAIHFHQVCKQVCDRHHKDYYSTYKERCDDYFYNAHRKEARGIGGLFFDYLRPVEGTPLQDRYNFVTELGSAFLDSYLPIVEKRKAMPFTEAQKEWQLIRRGRYAEFNLLYDLGTTFGLKTNGRTESILMSLPPEVRWAYNHKPEAGSEEEKLVKVLETPRSWV